MTHMSSAQQTFEQTKTRFLQLFEEDVRKRCLKESNEIEKIKIHINRITSCVQPLFPCIAYSAQEGKDKGRATSNIH